MSTAVKTKTSNLGEFALLEDQIKKTERELKKEDRERIVQRMVQDLKEGKLTPEKANLEEARKELNVRVLGRPIPEEKSFSHTCKEVVFIAIPIIVLIGGILGIILPLYYGGII